MDEDGDENEERRRGYLVPARSLLLSKTIEGVAKLNVPSGGRITINSDICLVCLLFISTAGRFGSNPDTLIAKTPVVNEIPPWKWVTPEHSIQTLGNHSKNDPPYILKLDAIELICSTYKDHLQIYTVGSLNTDDGTSGAGYYIPKYRESYFIPCSSSSSLDTELLVIDAALQSSIKIQEKFPKLSLPSCPVPTRWGSWLETCNYYARHLQSVKKVVQSFYTDDAAAIQIRQELLNDETIEKEVTDIKSNFGYLLDAIIQLGKSGVELVEQINIMRTIVNKLSAVEGEIGKRVGEKMNKVLIKNDGYDILSWISDVLTKTCPNDVIQHTLRVSLYEVDCTLPCAVTQLA
ncbi:hypothetical protein ANN_02885 [Periplaneta americana]|uniref:Uncharacterized protein n=1 Tax=Periplaneta americana TaxID=6978 RepID=A0ABQ8TXP1_PERAM|nr:hypothetical protein ANN_02885 [Periplaneta americana]